MAPVDRLIVADNRAMVSSLRADGLYTDTALFVVLTS